MMWFKILRTWGDRELEEWVPETSITAARPSGCSVVGLVVMLEREAQLSICTVIEVAPSTEDMLKLARQGF